MREKKKMSNLQKKKKKKIGQLMSGKDLDINDFYNGDSLNFP
jgi:hypothetical protein